MKGATSMEIAEVVEDGMRRFRIGGSIGDCPDFETPVSRKAWKAGFRAAMRRKTKNEAIREFLLELVFRNSFRKV